MSKLHKELLDLSQIKDRIQHYKQAIEQNLVSWSELRKASIITGSEQEIQQEADTPKKAA